MNRHVTWLIVCVMCIATLVACGGSSKSSTAAQPTGSSSTNSVPSASVAPKALPSVCTLAPSSDIATVLGADAGTGTPQDYDPTYKTCSWTVTPPGAANANSLRVGVVAISSTDKGFGQPSGMGSPTSITGLGDNANLFVNPDPNFPEFTLIAVKGTTSVSADAHLTGTQSDPNATKADLVNIVRSVFTAVGA